MEANETRKDTAQICAPLKEIGEGDQPLEGDGASKLGKETPPRRTVTTHATLLATSMLKVTAFSKPPPEFACIGLAQPEIERAD